MIINEPGTYNLVYTATDECGNETVVNRELIVEEPIYMWSDATDEQIVNMVQRADRGEINLADYWHVGDERVVHLSAMEAISPLTDTHVAQDVTLVLMNVGGKTLNTATESGRTECSFIVGQKDCLAEGGRITISPNTNDGGWEGCKRRTWCNSVYYNAIPSTLRPIFKQHKNLTANGGTNATDGVESTDYFALPAEREVWSYTQYSSTYENALSIFSYYKGNTKTKRKNGSASDWWNRSPRASNDTAYCNVTSSPTRGSSHVSNDLGLAPFGCI